MRFYASHEDPLQFAERLTGSHEYRFRIGAYRVIFEIMHGVLWALTAFVDKIFHGANPAELPIEQPTKFETALNLRTAKALGLAIPASLLVSADVVIE